jgi:hypothetical protein
VTEARTKDLWSTVVTERLIKTEAGPRPAFATDIAWGKIPNSLLLGWQRRTHQRPSSKPPLSRHPLPINRARPRILQRPSQSRSSRHAVSATISDASALRSSGRVVAVGIAVFSSHGKARIILCNTSSSRETRRALDDFPAVCEKHFSCIRVVSRKRCQTNLTRCHVRCAVTKGLASLCKEKPEQPVRWLAEWLRTQSPLHTPPLSFSPSLLFCMPPSPRIGL